MISPQSSRSAFALMTYQIVPRISSTYVSARSSASNHQLGSLFGSNFLALIETSSAAALAYYGPPVGTSWLVEADACLPRRERGSAFDRLSCLRIMLLSSSLLPSNRTRELPRPRGVSQATLSSRRPPLDRPRQNTSYGSLQPNARNVSRTF